MATAKGQSPKPAPDLAEASPDGAAESTKLSAERGNDRPAQPRRDGPGAPARLVGERDHGVFSVELERFALVLSEGPGSDGATSWEVVEDGKPVWRLTERDLEHLDTFTRRMDRGLTLSAGTALEFREAARPGPREMGVLELRSEGIPHQARLGGFEASITELRVSPATGQLSYGGRLSFGGNSVEFNEPDVKELQELSREMRDVVRMREQGMSFEQIARRRGPEVQPELQPEVEPGP